MPNMNPKTGIHFGYIRTDSIHSDVLQTLLYSVGKDVSYASALEDFLADERRKHESEMEEKRIAKAELDGGTLSEDDDLDFDEDTATEKFSNAYQCDEPTIEGEYEGVKYRTSWLGGAMNLWIFESPFITKCRPCSLCVPGAGNLDQTGEYEAYGVPVAWLDDTFITERCEEAGFEVRLNEENKFYWFNADLDMKGTFTSAVISEVYEDCYRSYLQKEAPCASAT
jgi:hypothetical protein